MTDQPRQQRNRRIKAPLRPSPIPLVELEIQPLEVHRRLAAPAVQQQERSHPIVRATLQHVEHRRNSRPRQILYPTHHALNPLDSSDRLAAPSRRPTLEHTVTHARIQRPTSRCGGRLGTDPPPGVVPAATSPESVKARLKAPKS